MKMQIIIVNIIIRAKTHPLSEVSVPPCILFLPELLPISKYSVVLFICLLPIFCKLVGDIDGITLGAYKGG